MFIYLMSSTTLFILGTFGMIIWRKHIIIIIISLELLLLAVNMNFIIFSIFLDDIIGQIYCLLILTISAAESALGLALLIIYYRLRGGISIDLINLLKG